MGQDWFIVNLDRHEYQGSRGKLGEFFVWEGISLQSFTRWKYVQKPFDDARESFARVVPKHDIGVKPSCKVLRIPAELVTMIFKNIDCFTDALCLSLTDARLVSVGIDRMINIQVNKMNQSAGCRVLCLGDYALDADYPESLAPLVKKEVKEFLEKSTSSHHGGDKYLFYRMIRQEYDRVHDYGPRSDGWPGLIELEDQLPQEYLDDKDFQDSVYQLFFHENWKTMPMERVLCNLSKRQYVRESAIEELVDTRTKGKDMSQLIEGDRTYFPSLEHALLSQICWSSDGSIAMRYDKGLHRGAWAGDRFEVNDMHELQKAADFSDWEDVSKRVTSTLDDIWKSEFGKVWRAKK